MTPEQLEELAHLFKLSFRNDKEYNRARQLLWNHAPELIEAAKERELHGVCHWGREVVKVTEENEHLKSLLRKHQIREFGGKYYCVECGNYENECASDCELAKAIGKK